MEKLVIERTRLVQGEPVGVSFYGSCGYVGKIVLTFEEWLHFSKLIKEGQDSQKKKNEQRIEITIRGTTAEVKVKSESRKGGKVVRKISEAEVDAILGDISTPLELEQEDEAGVIKAEKEQGLVRSLIGGNDETDKETV